MLACNIPAEEEDDASVISVASSGAAAQKRATETDSDASQASKNDAQTEAGSVEEGAPQMKTNLNPRARRSSN